MEINTDSSLEVNTDWSGAREDFDRARPQQLEVYLNELKTKDVRLMAIDNFNLINELSAKYSRAELDISATLKTATIESFSDENSGELN